MPDRFLTNHVADSLLTAILNAIGSLASLPCSCEPEAAGEGEGGQTIVAPAHVCHRCRRLNHRPRRRSASAIGQRGSARRCARSATSSLIAC
jgi:hypothetical protein